MTIVKHIVTDANWDAGRDGHPVTGVVLHTMVGYMQGSENRFNDPASQVSVHYGVGMDGSVRQWVEEANTAYQAGNYPVNQSTIGIEHEDYGNAMDAVRTPALYESSATLVADICKRYGFPADTNHIFLHKNVIDKTRYPGGTACPDGLDTNKIISMAAAKLKEGQVTVGNVNNLNDLCVGMMGVELNAVPAVKNLIGVDIDTCIRTIFGYPAAKAFREKAGAAAPTATVLTPGNYQVK